MAFIKLPKSRTLARNSDAVVRRRLLKWCRIIIHSSWDEAEKLAADRARTEFGKFAWEREKERERERERMVGRFRNFCTYTKFISSKIDIGEKASLPFHGAIPGRRSVSQEAPTAREYVVAGAGRYLSPRSHVDPPLHR